MLSETCSTSPCDPLVSDGNHMGIILNAEREIAFDSPDHLMPWGTRHDNSTHERFNQKLWRIYPSHDIIKVLDMGCAGGGFVRSCINDGHFAVGLEGSDFQRSTNARSGRSFRTPSSPATLRGLSSSRSPTAAVHRNRSASTSLRLGSSSNTSRRRICRRSLRTCAGISHRAASGSSVSRISKTS
jgi:hypothetical protein